MQGINESSLWLLHKGFEGYREEDTNAVVSEMVRVRTSVMMVVEMKRLQMYLGNKNSRT